MICFETSKSHILTGRCGLSRHLLYTSERAARQPSAAWIIRAKGPKSSHFPSPLAPGAEVDVGDAKEVEVVVAMAEEIYEVAVAERVRANAPGADGAAMRKGELALYSGMHAAGRGVECRYRRHVAVENSALVAQV